jgi:outer membrane protein assembly factor BamB
VRKKIVAAALTAVLLGGAVAAAADWPAFRGPGGSGASGEKGLPLKWGPKEGIRWKVELPGRGLSSPAIAAGRVYLTASSGYRERRLHVLCLEQATGKKLWERQFAATGSTVCHPKTCMAAPTPVTDGEAVYALFATGDLAALDKDGNLLWYRSLVGDYPGVTNQVGMAASLALSGNTLLVPMENAGDSFAAGIDKKTGKNRWRVKRARDINWVTPLVLPGGGRPAAVFQTGTEATAYDVETGKVRWSYRGEHLASILSPTAGGGLVFLPGDGRGELRAVRPGPDGTTPEVAWTTAKFRAGYSTPAYHQGRLYGLGPVTVSCVDAVSGDEVWRQRVAGPVAASPVLGDGKLYVVNEQGMTTVYALGDRPKVLASNALYAGKGVDDRDRILATPALAGGAIFLRSDRSLYCIGAKAGR